MRDLKKPDLWIDHESYEMKNNEKPERSESMLTMSTIRRGSHDGGKSVDDLPPYHPDLEKRKYLLLYSTLILRNVNIYFCISLRYHPDKKNVIVHIIPEYILFRNFIFLEITLLKDCLKYDPILLADQYVHNGTILLKE